MKINKASEIKNKRTGSRNRSSIPLEILNKLNEGIEQTASLSEALALDFISLLSSVYPQHKIEIAKNLKEIDKCGILQKMTLSANWIYNKFLNEAELTHQIELLSNHYADTIRGIACYLISYLHKDINLSLKYIYNLANDSHFSVREWAWIAIRPQLIEQFSAGLPILIEYSKSEHENIRRFSSEISRPRGVWCHHIKILKNNIDNSLDLCKPILNNLQADKSRYVQNSVGNWLNDCAKNNQKWVIDLCNSWNNDLIETKYIIKRGYRNLEKITHE